MLPLQMFNTYLFIEPNRENMISRSSSVVTGLSLQTKRTFSGGLIFASGKSPTWGTMQDRLLYFALLYSNTPTICTNGYTLSKGLPFCENVYNMNMLFKVILKP